MTLFSLDDGWLRVIHFDSSTRSPFTRAEHPEVARKLNRPAELFTGFGWSQADILEKLPHGIDYELKRLYYDVSGHRPPIAALTSFIPMSQILFGGDFPYRTLGETAESLPQLGLSAADLQAIGRDNALKPLPNLACS